MNESVSNGMEILTGENLVPEPTLQDQTASDPTTTTTTRSGRCNVGLQQHGGRFGSPFTCQTRGHPHSAQQGRSGGWWSIDWRSSVAVPPVHQRPTVPPASVLLLSTLPAVRTCGAIFELRRTEPVNAKLVEPNFFLPPSRCVRVTLISPVSMFNFLPWSEFKYIRSSLQSVFWVGVDNLALYGTIAAERLFRSSWTQKIFTRAF